MIVEVATIAVIAGTITGVITLVGNVVWTTTKLTAKIESRLVRIETKLEMSIAYAEEHSAQTDTRIEKIEQKVFK